MSTDRDYLAAGLALGGLSDAELAEAQALADSDADFRAEVAAYDDTMSLVAESDEPVEISAETRAAILSIPATHAQENSTAVDPVEPAPPASLADHRESRERSESQDSSESHERVDGSHSTGREWGGGRGPNRRTNAGRRSSWLPYAAAAAALIVITGSGVTIWQQTQEQNQLEEDLTATQQQLDESARLIEADDLQTRTKDLPEGGTVTVLSSESEQLIRFSPHDVGQAPAGKSMQMWVIGIDGPESAGLMTDQPVTITDHEFATGSVFGITVEPEGGSEQPTTDPIIAIGL
ncbi:anti-sigma factor [Brevibacterium oceani]|uniref:anti-sigma factor n=1 Tax=Brevibacterium oceani TaxID=358099 RepID=UPI0015E67487|nr:anti-sigma factor [Brevibacterium oceani]